MEISPTGNQNNLKSKIKGKKKTSSGGESSKTFENEFSTRLGDIHANSIDDLLSDLKDEGKRFLDSQSQYDLMKYKQVVQKLLKMIIEEGFETVNLKRQRRDKADFTVISHINSKLAEIQQAVTRDDKAFNLMKTIEEIRGLIFDLKY
jgi:uncharacterized protein YaaR (DUF327 family)